eukprot:CAMPEP_0198154598 /NCGR_PEP_ID=MMETSP1443-20131203/68680_1 /TAXON_ID=186043 /ORGANISM="Entomoneis sp., Strain CCMP2396" /LENGTH=170 /DNA_ID=CAMNT_0043821279 /DNA_START=179 /DNA_END=691 /DNA_ORIENTATION=+
MNVAQDSIEHPEEFICPITQEIMIDPVVSRYGQSYERAAIVEWLAAGSHGCPLSRRPLTLQGIVTNHKLRTQIRDWQIRNEMDLVLIMKPKLENAFCVYLNLPEEETEHGSSEEEDEVENTIALTVRRVEAETQDQSQSTRRHRRLMRIGQSRNRRLSPDRRIRGSSVPP